MKKIISLILIAVFTCTLFVGCMPELNNDAEDILYNGIVYERYGYLDYNLDISEEHAKYIGDFIETYNYGQELPWEVYALNDEENLLYTAYTNWVKPGYVLPQCFGEEFASVEYVISSGIDYKVIPDVDYTEEVFPLKTFEGSVKLEDIVETEASDITEFTEHYALRFIYKNHADIRLWLDICAADGKYYLNVRSNEGSNHLHEIKAEYVELLTSAIPEAK